jgi:tetratricopeptide (TPR) repeat protein
LNSPFLQAPASFSLGNALVGLGHLTEATLAYHDSLDTGRKLKMRLPHMLYDALAGLARTYLAQGDLAQAQAHVEEILSHLQVGSLDGTVEPSRIYLTCYQVLRANGDPRAGEVLEAAYHLLQERAAKIDDEELRRSFLENVKANREIVAAWEQASRKRRCA